MTESAASRLRWRLQHMRHSLDEALADIDAPETPVSEDLREVRARLDALESRVSAIEERWQSHE